jgi:cytochrome P450
MKAASAGMGSYGGPEAGCPFSLLSTAEVDPFPAYEQARLKEGSVMWDPGMQAWLVLDYANCAHIETHEDQFANPYAGASPLVVKVKGGKANITLTQGATHERLRRFHMRLLSARAVAEYREHHVRPIISWLVDRILERGTGRAELVADLADQVPPRVIAALFGMPWQNDALIARILHCHEEIMAWIGLKNSGESATQRAIAASDELNAMLLPHIRARREAPAADFISRVWLDAPEYYGALEEEDALAICREIFLGGSDTTVHGISNSLYLVLSDANVRQAVERDREKALAACVEEAMRLFSAVQYRFRIAQQDCRLGAAQIQAGQTLVLVHAAANRDPARYACPGEVDLGRSQPTDHLAFNRGPRTCVGAGLARREMADCITAVLDRLPGVSLDINQPPPRFTSLFMRSFKPLHIVYGS